jgi:hypothetical protein
MKKLLLILVLLLNKNIIIAGELPKSNEPLHQYNYSGVCSNDPLNLEKTPGIKTKGSVKKYFAKKLGGWLFF